MARQAKVVDVTETDGVHELHFDDGRPPLPVTADLAAGFKTGLKPTAMEDGVAGPGGGKTAEQLEAEDKVRRDNFNAGLKSGVQKLGSWLTTPMRPHSHATSEPVENPYRAPVPQMSMAVPAAPAPQPPPAAGPPPPPAAQGVPPGIAAPPPPLQAAAPTEGAPTEGAPAPGDPIEAAAEARLGALMAPKPAGPAKMTPSTEKTTTESGAPYDTEQATMRMEADRRVAEATMAKAEADKATFDAQAEAAKAALPKLQIEAANREWELGFRQREHENKRQYLEHELKSYEQDAKLDPNRFFHNRSTVANVLSVIGMALGSAGSALTGTPNYAYNYVTGQIQNDIQAQRDEIERGSVSRNNNLHRFMEYYHGDLDQAQTALTIAMNKVATTEATQFAAQTQSKSVAANAQLFVAKFEQDSLKREQDLLNASIGKTTTEQTSKMSGGGSGGLSFDQTLKVLNYLKDKKKDESVTPETVAKQTEAYSAKKLDLVTAKSDLESLAKAYGLQVDWAKGVIVDPKTGKQVDPSKVSIPGLGRVSMPQTGVFSSEAARTIWRAQNKQITSYRKASTGVAFSPKEAEDARQTMIGETEADAVKALGEQVGHVNRMDREIDSSYDKPIVDARKTRAAQTNTERASSKPVKVKPYE